MKVLTLSGDKFSEACYELGCIVIDSGWDFDLVLGVATGGAVVAEELRVRCDLKVNCMKVKCCRPSTATKEKLRLRVLLRYLPVTFNNILRTLEHRWCELARLPDKSSKRQIEISRSCLAHLKLSKRVLIIDDAIDSGETLSAVVNYVVGVNNNVEVRTAVITQTWKTPSILPNYCLYKQVLIRFPWSADAK